MPGSDFGDDGNRWVARLGDIPEQPHPRDWGDPDELPAPPIHQRPAGMSEGEQTNPGTPKAKRGEAPRELDRQCGISRTDLYGCTFFLLLVEIILHVFGR